MDDNKNLNTEHKGTLDINGDVVSHADKILKEDTKKPKRKKRSAKSYLGTTSTTMTKALAKKKTASKSTASKKTVKASPVKTAVKKTVKKAVKKTAQKVEKKTILKPIKKTAPKVTRTKASVKKKDSYVFIDADQLPQNYNTTEVVLVARDPYCIYAYWQIDGQDTQRLEQELGDKMNGAVYTMRVFDVSYVDFNGFNSNGWFDCDELFMGNRYLNGCRDNTSYLAEIGVRTQDGGFYPLARSNTATTPRAHISDRSDLIWQEVAENRDPKIYIKVDVQNFKNQKKLFPKNNWQNYVKRISLSHHDILSFYARGVILSRYLQEKHYNQVEGSDELYLSTEKSFNAALIKRYGTRTEFIGASDYLTTSGAGFEMVIQENKVQDGFEFEIDTELIVRGKTEPGASVYLGEKKIDVKPDGTFTMHYHLPDGMLPLDLTAQSKSCAQKKQILTSVQRNKTQYRKFT